MQEGALHACSFVSLSSRPRVQVLLAFCPIASPGINYDPELLSEKLRNNWPEVYARALNVTTALGGFAASIARVGALRILMQCVLHEHQVYRSCCSPCVIQGRTVPSHHAVRVIVHAEASGL